MDQKQIKKKPQFGLKLQVNIPDAIEEAKTLSASNSKLETDLFFQEPAVSNQTDSDSTQIITFKERVVADVSSIKGGRKKQEDRYVTLPSFYNEKKDNQFFYAVYDGHGGSLVANILKQNLHCYLQKNENYQINMPNAIMDSFKKLNDQILKLQEETKVEGGSTALCALNCQDNLFVVNLGDSTCVLVDKDLQIEKLNSEHTLDREDEVKRVENLCTILDRSHVPRINGELAVTRSFGDKKHSEYGLIAVPEITHKVLTPNHKLLLIGTDGFWNVIRLDELKKLLEDWEKRSEGKFTVEQLTWHLLEIANNKNTNSKKDNMTLIAIDIQQCMFQE